MITQAKIFVKWSRVLTITLGLIILLFNISLTSEPVLNSKLVNTDWLQNNFSKDGLRIIDIRDNITDYWQEHIPGAVYFHPEAMRLTDDGVPGKLTSPEALVIMLGKMGINEQTTVIVYGENSDFKPAYLLWALDYIGHEKSALLDGGLNKWRKENRLLTQDYPKIKSVEYKLPAKLHQEIRASLDEVKKVVAQGDAVLLDVRTIDLYNGEKGNWKRKGHIKGAISHFWGMDLKDDGTWKDKEELKKVYEKMGATPDKNIITSCGQGQMSAHTYITLKYILGYPRVANYDGSFNEWSNIDELPVETTIKERSGLMAYEPKDYGKLIGMEGFSETLLKNHFTLYQGYVTNTNKLVGILEQMLKDGKTAVPEYAELKRRFGWEFNGMRLHEYYFDNLGGKGGMDMDRNGKLAKKIAESFGSYENWEKDFKATGAMRGIGWVVLYQDMANGKLMNFWINEHDVSHPAGCNPILIMDVFEHAFMIDYGLKRADYIEAFFKNINWKTAEARVK